LIERAISNARWILIEVIFTVVLVIVIFLWHFPSAAIPVFTIPVTVLLTFIPLHYAGVSLNVMSLAGIAIACGEMWMPPLSWWSKRTRNWNFMNDPANLFPMTK